MEAIKRFMTGASSASTFNLRAFWLLYSVELKVIFVFALVAIVSSSFIPSIKLVKDIAYSQLSSQPFGHHKVIALSNSERIDLKEMLNKSMSYSYDETQIGFYLKNLMFFSNISKIEAENRILSALPNRLSKKAKRYVRAVLKICEKHQVDPIWILSVMWTESHFNFSAKSWAGAKGLMQIMPATRKYVYQSYIKQGQKLVVDETGFNLSEYFPYKVPRHQKKIHLNKLVNIELGVIYLKNLLNSFKNHTHATIAYNMGPGWTKIRLRKNLPVGKRNQYLDKVQAAYKQIIRKI